MKEWLITVLELLVGSRQFKREARILSLQLAHEAGMKDGLSLDDTLHAASAYYCFALTGDNPLRPITPEAEA